MTITNTDHIMQMNSIMTMDIEALESFIEDCSDSFPDDKGGDLALQVWKTTAMHRLDMVRNFPNLPEIHKKYKDRLKIPVFDISTKSIPIFTGEYHFLASGYNRVVIGQRGPYIECNDEEMNLNVLNIPSGQMHRLGYGTHYYVEYRTKDGIKIYYQKKAVDYADYIIGKWYFSPFDVLAVIPEQGLVEDLVAPIDDGQPRLF